MKPLFYLSLLALLIFEILKIYFIMPFPGSQAIDSIDLAYFLHSWRWAFRIILAAGILYGGYHTLKITRRKWLPAAALVLVAVAIYMTNFKMSAEAMFRLPNTTTFLTAKDNKVPLDRLVLGISINGEARAYPIQVIAYHHQVYDTLSGKPIIATYCTVCRTGRVFESTVQGKTERFRLVGMDHFNAMFEDHTTKSWWRQANGECIAGPLKGQKLPEVPAQQVSLSTWIATHPNTLILQPDPDFQSQYDQQARYERGLSTSALTRRDTTPWQPKSWVVGIRIGQHTRAYDWTHLTQSRLINDTLGNQPIALTLSPDSLSFYAFRRPSLTPFTLHHDTLFSDTIPYTLTGTPLLPAIPNLNPLPAYQEYWHSWQTFHPTTTRYAQ